MILIGHMYSGRLDLNLYHSGLFAFFRGGFLSAVSEGVGSTWLGFVSGDMFQVRFCCLLSMDGGSFRSSRPDMFDVGLWARLDQVTESCSLRSLRFNSLCF